MMNIVYVVWMYVIVFAVIGALRGWAKELLVGFSVIVALAINHVLKKYIPLVSVLPNESSSLFWIRSLIVLSLVYFGYQTVISIAHLASKAVRERLQDTLFGIILGGLNGYLIAGTVLFYYIEARYPYPNIVSAPLAGTPLEASLAMMYQYLPPHLLGEPGIYFAVILAFVFILVVYI
ncbi:MAG: CvpA family protein [Anaerolineales bacterium]|nr:CvpA family protein [Anaerolineales bacterium]